MKHPDNDLHDLFLSQLSDALSAEHQLVKALPKMATAANSPQLADAFETHLVETKDHVTRVERAFKSLGESPHSKKCKAMEGLLAEGKEMLEEEEDSAALDAALIAAAQKVEHYEIATYGTLCAWAQQMDHTEAAELLGDTLREEKAADQKLTEIAENLCNPEAEESQSKQHRKAA